MELEDVRCVEGAVRVTFKNLNRAETLAFCAIAISVLTLLTAVLGMTGSHFDRSPKGHEQRLVSDSDTPSPNLPNDELSATSIQVAGRAARSVVRVEVSFSDNSQPANDLETYFGRLPQERLASGVVVGADGLVVTNYHVVRGAESISIVDSLGNTYAASMLGHDALTDFALLQVPGLNLPAITWGDSDQVVTGQLVWAIGNPYGLDQSVSMGIVSSTKRPTVLDSPFQDFLQTDASINPGNSGGALVDSQGRLIGINTAIAGDSFQGISFALPSNTAEQVIRQLKTDGHIARGWIGVQLSAVSASRAAIAGLKDTRGAFVESLVNGNQSPAHAAGLKVEDIVIRFDGKNISGPLGLLRQIAKHPIGTNAKLTAVRSGEEVELEIRIAERP